MAEKCPDPDPECKYYETKYCLLTVHHTYWPRKIYRSLIEKTFRELDEHKEILPRCEHDELHASQDPPIKPDRENMIQIIQRCERG